MKGLFCMTKDEKRFKLLIMADLRVAKKLILSDNKYDRLIAAYHIQQAIEKTIKLVAVMNGINLWGHDIEYLINECDKQGEKNIYIPELIRSKAGTYTEWEADCRYYPSKVVYKKTLLAAYQCIEEWLKEIK